ncbi:MAG TPA: RsmE family RNA methyltransferase [Candidatus Babeliales bacterium]|jgi:RsmE family RNA methyltransferase|nr:RsmE family RNA methyltransferase [Candidatus Babeliales bacterium]
MDDIKAYKDKHQFALYKESLSLLVQKKELGDNFVLTDEILVHRMMNVLRLSPNDKVILFDKAIYVIATIKAFVSKKQMSITIDSIHSTIILHPDITFLLPVLKREDYEAALYSLTEIGVNNIQLVFTQKTGNKWSAERDQDRAERIIIAAAEQSKNFAYPTLYPPISLQVALKKYNSCVNKIFFDPEGKQVFDIMQMLHAHQPDQILLLVGPEGDLTLEEKEMVRAHQFIFCALTPTILRAVQATGLAAGLIRSFFV